MAGFWKKLFGVFEKTPPTPPPPPAPDPAEVAMQRRIKLNALQSRFSLEVKKQDKFMSDYLAQAVEAKRTGDALTLGSIKNSITLTVAMRRRAQRMLHAVRHIATFSEQLTDIKDFCKMISEEGLSIGETLSAADVSKTQQNLHRVLQGVQTNAQFVDQLLGTFDASLGEMATVEEATSGVKSSAIDEMIATLAGQKDSATERRIEELMAKL